MSDNVKMIAAPPWMLSDLWPRVGALLFRGVLTTETDPEFAMDDLKTEAAKIVDGRSQLWLVLQEEPKDIIAAFCTSILLGADGRTEIHLHTCAGSDLKSWGHLLAPTIDAFARAEGATVVTYEGREAWSRVLPAVAVGQVDGVTSFERNVQ